MSDPNTEAREFVQRFVEGLPTDVQKLRESAEIVLAALEQAGRALEEEREARKSLRERTNEYVSGFHRESERAQEAERRAREAERALEQAKLEVEERFTKQGAALAEAAKQRRRAEAAERALVWLLCERTGRPIAAYSDRATAIERRVELARRNPSTFPIRATEVVSVIVDPTVDELFDPDALRKPRAPQSTDAA